MVIAPATACTLAKMATAICGHQSPRLFFVVYGLNIYEPHSVQIEVDPRTMEFHTH